MPNQTQTSPGKGVLKGRVTIGPLRPGPSIVGEEESVDPQIFVPLRVVIVKPGTKERVQTVKLDGKGNYTIELDPGKYLVDVTPHKYGIRPGRQILQEVNIELGKTSILNLYIDTGIR